MQIIDEFDRIALIEDLPAEGLAAGTVGTVLDVYERPVIGYAVEFYVPERGNVEQYVLVELFATQVRLVERYVPDASIVAAATAST